MRPRLTRAIREGRSFEERIHAWGNDLIADDPEVQRALEDLLACGCDKYHLLWWLFNLDHTHWPQEWKQRISRKELLKLRDELKQTANRLKRILDTDAGPFVDPKGVWRLVRDQLLEYASQIEKAAPHVTRRTSLRDREQIRKVAEYVSNSANDHRPHDHEVGVLCTAALGRSPDDPPIAARQRRVRSPTTRRTREE